MAEDHLGPAERGERGSYVSCIAGALSRREYLDGPAAAGFVDATVTYTHEVAPGMLGATIRANKPTALTAATAESGHRTVSAHDDRAVVTAHGVNPLS